MTTSDGELEVVVRAVQSLKERIVAGEARESTTEAWARQTLDTMSQLCLLTERLNQTISGECMPVAGLSETELS